MPRGLKRSPHNSVLKAFALMSAISSYLLGAILLGVFGGRWLDQYFGTGSIFLILLLAGGLASAVYGIYSAVKKFTEDENDSNV